MVARMVPRSRENRCEADRAGGEAPIPYGSKGAPAAEAESIEVVAAVEKTADFGGVACRIIFTHARDVRSAAGHCVRLVELEALQAAQAVQLMEMREAEKRRKMTDDQLNEMLSMNTTVEIS